MKVRAVLLAVVVTLVVPTVASAHRPAVRAEKAAMMYTAGSHYDGLSAKDVDRPRAYPMRCAVADVATVVKGSQWGAWAFNARLSHDRTCVRWGSNGWVIEHKIGRRWYVIVEMNTLPPHIAGVPHRIAVDLFKGLR